MKFDPIQATDFYKVGHKAMYPSNVQTIYSNMTPRSNKRAPIHPLTGKPIDYVVNIGLQGVLTELTEMFDEYFFRRDIEEIIKDYDRRNNTSLYPGAVDSTHIRELHALGFLPIEVFTLPEGVRVPIGIPLFTIENTHSDFAWVTNYLETVLSSMLWKTITVATIASAYRDVISHYAVKTGSPMEFVDWQGHDFSFRGLGGPEDAARSNIGHLFSFLGTDTIPAICYIENYYGGVKNNPFIGGSVPATEHSVMCAGGQETEIETYRRLLKQYPTGIISIVSDTWDYWQVLTDYTVQLKDEILNRVPNEMGIAKVVFRPDSGDPVKIICGDPDAPIDSPEWKGSVEVLWDIFGGTTTSTGHRVLNQRVGLIYGDSITLERANEILKRLDERGFASCNIVFGIGSYTYQYITRDTFGFAIKATAAYIDDKGYVDLYKNPKTDDGTKKSARGILRVVKSNGKYVLKDQQHFLDMGHNGDCLERVYIDGTFVRWYDSWDKVKANRNG